MIGCHTDVGALPFDHLQHTMQHPGDRAELPRATLAETLQAVELPEQLVGAVDEVDDHPWSILSSSARHSPRTTSYSRIPSAVNVSLIAERYSLPITTER